ncbi:hypothetical protein GE107_02510 [Cohnella sp. CFH 77786]|uniref:hypothetical protein n=1 Tax=Cohnella sp. CFH 77786 TaxID=2662265 RepID=UPI001C60E10F|nr:hypothetical protein [Cohnella sp. CFH 77786]MBW5444937.1 hypothetical protein [Cohnella sp. CFH 77786]
MFVPAEVRIGSIKINNVGHQSGVSFGTTVKTNRNVNAKKNQGFGQQFADGVLRCATVHMVLDDDLADAVRAKINRV